MQAFRTKAGYAREVIAVTLLIGIGLHTSALFLGRERFVAEVFTPTVDRILFALMAYGAIAAAINWRRFDLATWGRRIPYGILVGYLLVSLVFHGRAVREGSTEFVLDFPSWYSAVILPVQAAFLAIVAHLRLARRGGSPTSGPATTS